MPPKNKKQPKVKKEALIDSDENEQNTSQISVTLGNAKVVAETHLRFLDMSQFAPQNVVEGNLVAEVKKQRVFALDFSPDEKFLAVGTWDSASKNGTVTIFSATTLKKVKAIEHCSCPAVFNTDSSFLLALSNLDPTLISLLTVDDSFKEISSVCFYGDGDEDEEDSLLTCSCLVASPSNPDEFLVAGNGKVHLASIESKKVIWTAELDETIEQVSFLVADKILASYGESGKFAVIQNGIILKTLHHEDAACAVCLTVFTTTPRFATFSQKRVVFWNSQTLKPIRTAALDTVVRARGVVLPDDRAIVLPDHVQGGLTFLNSETGEKLESRMLGKQGAELGEVTGFTVAASSSGKYVAVYDDKEDRILLSSIHFTQPPLGKSFMKTQTLKAPITDLEFAQDGMSVIATDLQNKKQTIELDFDGNRELLQATKEAVERMEKLRLESELEENKRKLTNKERENEELKRQLAEARASATSASGGDGGGGSGLTAKRRERD